MKKYEVMVRQTVIETAWVEIDADTVEEALVKAKQTAKLSELGSKQYA